MIGSFFEYPAANTVTRCIKANLLHHAEWNSLVMADTLPAALNALLATSYGTVFDFSTVQQDALPSMRDVEHGLHTHTISSLLKTLRFLHGTPAMLIIMLLRRYELLNIKKTLRRLSQPGRKQNRLAIPDYDLGHYGLARGPHWETITDTQQLGRLLENTCYRNAYRDGLAAFGADNDLLVFESVLEKEYYTELNRCLEQLGFGEQEKLRTFTGSYLDEVCLTAFVRMKFQHGMAAPAILPLLPIEGCLRFSEQLFWRIADTGDEDACCEQLKKEWKWSVVAGDSLAETVQGIRRRRRAACRSTFLRGSPLGLGPMVAYYFLKE